MAGEHHHNGWENQRCAVKVGTTPRDLPLGTTVNFPKKSGQATEKNGLRWTNTHKTSSSQSASFVSLPQNRDLTGLVALGRPVKTWRVFGCVGSTGQDLAGLVALGRPVKKEFSATQAFIRSLNLTSSPVPQTGCRLQNRALRAKKSISTTYQRFRLHTRPHSPLRPALHVLQRHPTRRGRLAHKVVVALLSGHTQNIREGAKRSRERARLKITATVYSPKRSNTRV